MDDIGPFMAAVFVVIGFIIFVVMFASGTDENGFSCPPGSQTVWEFNKFEIEGCKMPDGTFIDDPDD